MNSYYDFVPVDDLPEPVASPFIIPGQAHDQTALLCGRPESGKSFYALSIGHAIANGTPWLGRSVREKRTVGYWGLDPGAVWEIKRRCRWLNGTKPLFSDTPPSRDADWWNRFADLLCSRGVRFLIIDNLIGLLGHLGGSYNDEADVLPVMSGVNKIANAGVAVLLIHHTGKGSTLGPAKTPIGATCIEANARHLILVETVSGGVRVNTKGNDAEPETFVVSLDVSKVEGTAFFELSTETVAAPRQRGEVRRNRAAVVAEHVVKLGLSGPLAEIGRRLEVNPPPGQKTKSAEAWAKDFGRIASSGLLEERDGRWQLVGS